LNPLASADYGHTGLAIEVRRWSGRRQWAGIALAIFAGRRRNGLDQINPRKSLVIRLRNGIELVVVTRMISWLFGTTQLDIKFGEDRRGNHLTALAVDRVGNIGIQFLRRFGRRHGSQFDTTLIAICRPHVIFVSAPWAMAGQFAAWHGNERSRRAINDF